LFLLPFSLTQIPNYEFIEKVRKRQRTSFFFFSFYLFGAMIGSCFGKFFLGFLSSLGGLIQFGLSLQFLLYLVVGCSSATKDSTTMV
jgi:hypothetical protein